MSAAAIATLSELNFFMPQHASHGTFTYLVTIGQEHVKIPMSRDFWQHQEVPLRKVMSYLWHEKILQESWTSCETIRENSKDEEIKTPRKMALWH